ncbi:MAG: hypothetical protein R3F18_02350 [Lysobacterales bacterium]
MALAAASFTDWCKALASACAVQAQLDAFDLAGELELRLLGLVRQIDAWIGHNLKCLRVVLAIR